ncbi:MAG: M15 family metallopeptidase [Actinomycetota bacterium]
MTVNVNSSLRADARGWGPGWPHCSVHAVPLVVGGTSFPAGVAPEIHDLLELLLVESEKRGLVKLHPGWCWGYGCRPITGTTTVPSNHSWGLAIDINAPVNGYGSASHTIEQPMATLWNRYGFRWGGNYSTTKDWMHFEFMGTPADAREMTDKARKDFGQEDALTKAEKEQLDQVWAFVQELEKRLAPGKDSAPAGASADRVARAVKHVEGEVTKP